MSLFEAIRQFILTDFFERKKFLPVSGHSAFVSVLKSGEFRDAKLRYVWDGDPVFGLLRRDFKILVFERSRYPNISRAFSNSVTDGLASRTRKFEFADVRPFALSNDQRSFQRVIVINDNVSLFGLNPHPHRDKQPNAVYRIFVIDGKLKKCLCLHFFL
jgi:hypothetical protein